MYNQNVRYKKSTVSIYVQQIAEVIMKKDVGIEKEIDALGRIVIPKEIRERFSIDGRVELVLTEEGVLIRSPKYKLVTREEVPTISDSNN